jgi:transcriptional regulator with XRE-family HTH domain
MLNSEEFIKRIERIVEFYSLTASSFADKIDVQRSSISHLLSGRNNPSLEFVLKVTSAFPEVNLYWLLYGKGSFPHKLEKQITPTPAATQLPEKAIPLKINPKKTVQKVILFYDDGSFETYDN